MQGQQNIKKKMVFCCQLLNPKMGAFLGSTRRKSSFNFTQFYNLNCVEPRAPSF